MHSIYDAPESEVTFRHYGEINLFQRFSTWYTIILIILTLGLYVLYWMHTRTKVLNKIVRDQISSVFTCITAFLFVASYVVGMVEIVFDEFSMFQDMKQYFTYLPTLEIISNIIFLVWVFKFRNRLQETFSSADIDIGIIPTFFFQIIYLQYKINRLIDQKYNNEQVQKDVTE